MKKRLRFQMPHVPLKVLRGEQDKEDIQDQYYERFQAPPGTSTEEEEANAWRGSSSSHWESTTDIGNVSESLGSIHSISESNNASDEGSEDVPSDHVDLGLNNTGYQTMGSVSHEAIELQAFADVHQLPYIDSDATINTDNTNNTGSGVASIGNVSEDSKQRFLGEHTGTIGNASQSDTASHEAIELQGFSRVHQPPNTDSNVTSVGNISEEAMGRYLGANTGSIHSAFESDPGSQEGVGNLHNNTGYEATGSVSHETTELQSFAQVHKPSNTQSDVTINTDNISEEAVGRYLGRHTSSIDNVSQSDTALDEAIELQGFSPVHQPPHTDSDIVSISNINKEIMRRYLGEHTGSINSASQSDTASHEGIRNVHNDQINNTGYEATNSVSNEAIEMQVLPQAYQLPNIDNHDSDVLSNEPNVKSDDCI